MKKCLVGELTFYRNGDTGKTNIKRGPEAAKAGKRQQDGDAKGSTHNSQGGRENMGVTAGA